MWHLFYFHFVKIKIIWQESGFWPNLLPFQNNWKIGTPCNTLAFTLLYWTWEKCLITKFVYHNLNITITHTKLPLLGNFSWDFYIHIYLSWSVILCCGKCCTQSVVMLHRWSWWLCLKLIFFKIIYFEMNVWGLLRNLPQNYHIYV